MHHSSEDFNLTTAIRQSLMQKYFDVRFIILYIFRHSHIDTVSFLFSVLLVLSTLVKNILEFLKLFKLFIIEIQLNNSKHLSFLSSPCVVLELADGVMYSTFHLPDSLSI